MYIFYPHTAESRRIGGRRGSVRVPRFGVSDETISDAQLKR